jgi:hypothetical protein
MISILGPRMVMMIILGALLLGGGAGLSFYYLDPELLKVVGDQGTTEREVREKNNQISQIKVELENLKGQILVFNQLKEKSFFVKQDRIVAQEAVKDLSKVVGLYEASIITSPPKIIDSVDAKTAEQALVSWGIVLKLNTTNDTDIYKFLLIAQKIFPGYLEFRGIRLNRTVPVDQKMLSQIRKTGPFPIVKAEAEFTWWSMIPVADAAILATAISGVK